MPLMWLLTLYLERDLVKKLQQALEMHPLYSNCYSLGWLLEDLLSCCCQQQTVVEFDIEVGGTID
jgi:hypothetical protein